jgi:TolB protein
MLCVKLSKSVIFALGVVASGPLVATALSAGGDIAQETGHIVFSRHPQTAGHPTAALFVVEANGRGERRLTRPKPGYTDEQPDWAPDGKSVVFTRCPPNDGACGIWSIRTDGTGARRLSPSCPAGGTVPRCADDGDAAYSPDGHRIAFFRFTGSTAALMIGDLELKHPHAIALGHEGAWSPDGKRIAFERFNDPGTKLKPMGARAVFVVDSDGKPLRRLQPWSVVARLGKGLRRLTPWSPSSGDFPVWAPDGTRILFRTLPGSEDIAHSRGNLYTIKPDGTGRQQLTHFSARKRILQNGSYSPDGGSIVFATNATPDRARGAAELFVIGADGTHLQRLTHSGAWEDSPDWGP